MYCKKGIYVNWGNIPNLEFDFGPINLFSGGNGSGKTTAADGLQSLMTAAHENLFTYNPGQDETTQKGRGGKNVRTLASYVLGCDDGSYSRVKPTDGYVAGVFHPTQGETSGPFTAVMCVRARIDNAGKQRQARQDDILFLILPDEELSLSDFVVEDKGGKYVVPINEIANRLKMKHGQSNVETYDKKGPYLRRLYGALRGMKTAVSDREAKHAARTFSNFMAYKPVKSITEFVAREVLEPKDLSEDIRQVSELMKTIHSMDQETRHLKSSIGNLEEAISHANSYLSNWTDYQVGQYCETTCQLLRKQKEYVKAKNEQRDNLQNIQGTETELAQHAELKNNLHEKLINLQAQRQGIQALKDKDQLEKDVNQLEEELVRLVPPLLEQDHQFSKNFEAATDLQKKLTEYSIAVDVPSLDSKNFQKSLKAVLNGARDTGLDTQQLLTKDWVGISSLEDKLQRVRELEALHHKLAASLDDDQTSESNSSIKAQVYSTLHKKEELLSKSKQQHKAKEQEIQQLGNKRINYPPYVEAALLAIQNQCPKAKPCVLCDFIEVTDSHWQMAIEGYIGGARFSIIVEPDYEAEAIRIVRSLPNQRIKARVIQGSKAQRDAAKLSLPQNSIFNVMAFSHKIVEHYIKASYGSLVQVNSEEELRKTSRGLTANGLGSGSYSMFRCDMDDSQLVFGQGARERALKAKTLQLEELYITTLRYQEEYRNTQAIYKSINDIKNIQCSKLINVILGLFRKRQHNEDALENIDLSDHSALEEKLQILFDEHKATEEQGNQFQKNLGALQHTSRQIEKTITKLANEQEALQDIQTERESDVYRISKHYAEFNAEVSLRQADEKAERNHADFDFEQENIDTLSKMDKGERQLYNTILHHNQMSNTYNNIVYFTGNGERNDEEFFSHIVTLSQQIRSIYNSLKNNVLVDRDEQLHTLKDSFNTAFVTNLCHSIYQSINHGKRILEDLNKELEHHRFGADQERFYFDFEWEPEFKEYWLFFKDIIDIPNLGDGSTLFDAQLSEKSCSVRDKLMGMLLDKDEQVALRELRRISDYRNYRRYEIYKEPLNKSPIALSTYGTGSGGQLETPAYIIRSAAVTSAFRFSEGNSHCRMVLVDEAFSKMDETRSREVIDYLTKTLGLQLIFIMPTSKSGPFMDLISHQTIFSKCPTAQPIGELNTRVLVDRKVCNQENIEELWANHRKTMRKQAMLDFMEEI